MNKLRAPRSLQSYQSSVGLDYESCLRRLVIVILCSFVSSGCEGVMVGLH